MKSIQNNHPAEREKSSAKDFGFNKKIRNHSLLMEKVLSLLR
jgi:hypothetical protein